MTNCIHNHKVIQQSFVSKVEFVFPFTVLRNESAFFFYKKPEEINLALIGNVKILDSISVAEEKDLSWQLTIKFSN